MAGYNRNDTVNNIADGNIINASDLDGEFNAIDAAFDETTGHEHDGTSGGGKPITKVGPSQDVVVGATAVTPKTDNTVDLGSSTFEFKDLYIDGTANIDSLVADTADINAGTIDGVTIGGASAGAGTFTTVAATTGNITTVNATTVDTTNIEVTAIKAKDGTASATITDSTGVMTIASSVLTTTDINGGTIDGTAIGGSTAAAGAFTTLSASGAFAANGGATLGDASGDALTINSSAVSIPNGLNFDSNTFVIDATNNRVGVGVASPTQNLDVAGIIRSSNAGTENILINGGTNTASIQQNGTNFFFNSNTNTTGGGFIWRNGSGYTERMRIDSTGQVGIGTAELFSGLTIADPASANNAARLNLRNNNSDGSNRIGIISYNSNTVSIATGNESTGAANNTLALFHPTYTIFYTGTTNTNPSERMRITSTGNVGIGTSSPTSPLHVVRSGSSGTTAAFGSAATNNQGFNVAAVSDNSTTVGIGVFGSAAGSAGMLTANSPYLGTSAAELNLYSSNASGVIKFATGGFTERMRLDSSGNLGLGVTPSAWSNIQTVLQIKNSSLIDQSGIPILGTNYFYNGTNNLYITSAAASRYYQSSGSHVWQTAPSGTAGNAITFTQAMTLDASGNLGIGTSSPSRTLDVRGYVSSYDGTTRTEMVNSSGVGYFGTATNHPLALQTNNTERMRITSGGDVGIGTSSPTSGARLDVVGGNLRVQRSYDSGATPLTVLNTAVASKRQAYDTAIFQSDDAPAIRITEVNGSTSDTIGELTLSGGDGNVQVIGGTGALVIATNRANGTQGYTSSGERMRIDSNAVAIGVIPISRNNTCLQIKDGIGFPSTQVASSDANTLDDYEEGTFTPTLVFASGSTTYTTQTGTYTKVGRLVTVQIYIVANTVSSPSGSLEIGGLPFTISSTSKGAISIAVSGATASATTSWIGLQTASSTNLRIYTYSAGAVANPGAYVQNGTDFSISVSYQV